MVRLTAVFVCCLLFLCGCGGGGGSDDGTSKTATTTEDNSGQVLGAWTLDAGWPDLANITFNNDGTYEFDFGGGCIYQGPYTVDSESGTITTTEESFAGSCAFFEAGEVSVSKFSIDESGNLIFDFGNEHGDSVYSPRLINSWGYVSGWADISRMEFKSDGNYEFSFGGTCTYHGPYTVDYESWTITTTEQSFVGDCELFEEGEVSASGFSFTSDGNLLFNFENEHGDSTFEELEEIQPEGSFQVVGINAGLGSWSYASEGVSAFDGEGTVVNNFQESETGVGANIVVSETLSYTNPTGNVVQVDGIDLLLSELKDVFIYSEVGDQNDQGFGLGVKLNGSGLSNSTLSGDYAAVSIGAGDGDWSYATAGTITFDGVGGFTAVGLESETGVGANIPAAITGTYSVESDGILVLNTDDPSTLNGAISASGDMFIAANVSEMGEQTLTIGIKVGGSGFSNTSLSGSYELASFATGNGNWSFAESGTAIFDGVGGCSISSLVSGTNVGANVSESSTLTYTVNGDGTLNMTDTAPHDFRGAISLTGNMFIYAGVDDANEQEIGIGIKTPGAP